MVPPDSHRVPRVLRYSGYLKLISTFAYRAVTFSGWPFQTYSTRFNKFLRGPTTPVAETTGLGSSHFARRYYGNRVFFLFLRVIRCFSSPGCLPYPILFRYGCMDFTPCGLPHSDTSGSKPAYGSPKLFAVNRVLRRLLAPRHSPYALSIFAFVFTLVFFGKL